MVKILPDKIRAWVETHFDFKERKDGAELQICNPFDGDTGYNFNISTAKATCHDWRGDTWQGTDREGKVYKRTFLNFVRAYKGCTWAEAAKEVTGENSRFFLPRKAEREEQAAEEQVELPSGSLSLWDPPHPQQAGILTRWLASRGVTAEDVRRYKLHYIGSEVVWPYYECELLVYWQSRSRMDKRFRFPPSDIGVGKGDFLYGYDDIEPASHLIITEAIFDKHTLREQTVASGGAVLTSKQLAIVRELGPRDGVVLAPDNDKAGMASVVANGRLLLERRHKVFYSVPPEMEYEVEGEKRTTKDWNELLAVMPAREIPQVMDKNIRKLDLRSLVSLQMRALGQKNGAII